MLNFYILRKKFLENVVVGSNYDINNPYVKGYIGSLYNESLGYLNTIVVNEDYLWDDLKDLTNGYNLCETFRRVLVIVKAYYYCNHNNFDFVDAVLINQVLSVLNKFYNKKTKEKGNWWEWRIGIPWNYAQIVSIIYNDMTPYMLKDFKNACNHFVRSELVNPFNDKTYANLASECRNLLAVAILTNDEDDINLALKKAIPAFVDNTSICERNIAYDMHNLAIKTQNNTNILGLAHKQEGLYSDGSFLQHYCIPYIGTYGAEIINMARIMYDVFPVTAIPQEIEDSLGTWIEKAYIPAVYQGEMMQMYMGRGNSRFNGAKNIMMDCLSVIDNIGNKNLLNLREICKENILAKRLYSSEYDGLANPCIDAAIIDKLISEPKIAINHNISIIQAAGDRVVYEGDNYVVGLAMSSNRIGKYEAYDRATAKENLKGWYTGDGMYYIYTPENKKEHQGFFENANPYYMPGTTDGYEIKQEISTEDRINDAVPEAAKYARCGGLMIGADKEQYGTAMMHLIGGQRSTVDVNKSWYFFHDKFLCFAKNNNSFPIETVIDQVKANEIYCNGEKINLKNGTTKTISTYGQKRIYIKGDGINRGYIVRGNTNDVKFSKCKEYPEYCQIYSDSYELVYDVFPNISKEEFDKIRVDFDLNAKNDCNVHGYKYDNYYFINFFNEDTYIEKEMYVESDGMAIVGINKQEGNMLEVSVVDPSWDRSKMKITINGNYSLMEPNNRVKVTHKNNSTILTINSKDMFGLPVKFNIIKNEI